MKRVLGFSAAAAALVLLSACGQSDVYGPTGKAPEAPVIAAPEPPPEPGPRIEQATGVIRRGGGQPQAGFQLVTSSGANYFVKLVNEATGEEVLVAFVRGGETFETDVPLGDYAMRYATGQFWFGEQHLFGAQTGYYRADDTLRFFIEGNTINGNAIRLIPQAGGTLESLPLDPSAF